MVEQTLRQEGGKSKVRVARNLPLLAAAWLEGTGDPVLILRGEPGYIPFPEITDPEAWNRSRGVTPAQAEAMQVGSMYGWDVPGANPRAWAHLNARQEQITA